MQNIALKKTFLHNVLLFLTSCGLIFMRRYCTASQKMLYLRHVRRIINAFNEALTYNKMFVQNLFFHFAFRSDVPNRRPKQIKKILILENE